MYIIVKIYNGRLKGLANMMFRNEFAGYKSLTHNYLFRKLDHSLMCKMHRKFNVLHVYVLHI